VNKAIDLSLFAIRYLGAGNVGENSANRGQCVGLIEVWLTSQGKPHIPGNAKDLLTGADPKQYRVIPNGPQNYPQPGDVVCWDGSWGGGFGHTAIVVAANAMHIAVFEQNDPESSPCIIATHDYSGVAGWVTW
jgi:hypothetical protein